MVQIEHLLGNTYCMHTAAMSLPFYHVGDGSIVLMDSGLTQEGQEMEEALDAAGFRVAAILTSHAHYDHMGNHLRFRQRYGAEIWSSEFDAAATRSVLTLQATFRNERIEDIRQEYGYMVCPTDHIFSAEDTSIQVKGAVFTLLALPGHALSHTGFVTPDGVAYLADLMQGEQVVHAKLLFAQCWSIALESMRSACTMPYPQYVLAHGSVYSKLEPLVQANETALQRQLQAVLDCMDHWMNRQEIMEAAVLRLGVQSRRPIRIHVAERSVDALVDYLITLGKVESSVQGACLCYRRIRQEEEP